MPRAKKKPSIEQQLRSVIAQATEEGRYDLAKKLIDFLDPVPKQYPPIIPPPGLEVKYEKA